MITENIKLDTSWTGKGDRSVDNVHKIATIITHDVEFAKDKAGFLYYYDKGVYNPRGEQAIEELYKQWLKECDALEDWSALRGTQIIKYITIGARDLWDKPPVHRINLLNGIYNIETGMLESHTTDWVSTMQIPIEYNPEAKCPKWDEFLQDVLPYSGGPNYLREILGMCMIPFTKMQKCIVLVGRGSNGKSTFLNGMRAFIGENNISAVSLHEIANPNNRFDRANMVGKLVNIFGDLPAKKIEETSHFKSIVGEDTITVEHKHKQSYPAKLFARLIFSCNEVVKSDDESDGYKRRFIHIPFRQKFEVNPKKGMELEDNLSDPRELSGLLNKVLPTLARTMEDGLTLTPEIACVIDEWTPMSDAMKVFLENLLEEDPDCSLPMTAFYQYFFKHSPGEDHPIENAKTVKFVRSVFPNVEAGHVAWVNGKSQRCYKGIRVKDISLHTWMENWNGRDDYSIQ